MNSILRYRTISRSKLATVQRRLHMKRKSIRVAVFVAVFLSVLVAFALATQDKYTAKVPNGLSFSEFRGYEAWQLVSISQDGPHIAAILANPVMIKAYLAGI